MNMNHFLDWALRLIPAGIVGQTLPFKFLGKEESVQIFRSLADGIGLPTTLEPALRLGTGSLELIAIVLLLLPATARWGAIAASGLMAGALLSHLTILGFSGPAGPLAILAALALAFLGAWLFLNLRQEGGSHKMAVS